MRYRFDPFELDPAAFELRRDGETVAAEPQVLALIVMLVRERDRLVTKDEIIEEIWDGRIVSDSAVSSRIKTARQLLGDDGREQRMIRTVHGRGFRFVGEVVESVPAAAGASSDTLAVAEPQPAKPSIAVLPFRLIGVAGPHAPIAEALPSELITELSRLRWLFVIARASSFRLADQGVDIRNAGALLGVRYCLSGTIEVLGDRMTVLVELADTDTSGVVWTDRYDTEIAGIHELREQIVRQIISALELHIPLHEARRAQLVSPENLDAWAAYHVGLSHMFKGDPDQIAMARQMFERSLELEPGFARAMAGLSCAHFMTGFLRAGDEAGPAALATREFAEKAVTADPLDPFVNMSMGRSLWLDDDLESSLGWLERATDLSPSYAQAIYSQGWTETLLGEAESGAERASLSMQLSPLDPLHYAFLGVQALSAMSRGDTEAAADWAEKAARSPGAHALIRAIAVAANHMAGRAEAAERWASRTRDMAGIVTQQTFMQAFPYRDVATRDRIAKALAEHGF